MKTIALITVLMATLWPALGSAGHLKELYAQAEYNLEELHTELSQVARRALITGLRRDVEIVELEFETQDSELQNRIDAGETQLNVFLLTQSPRGKHICKTELLVRLHANQKGARVSSGQRITPPQIDCKSAD